MSGRLLSGVVLAAGRGERFGGPKQFQLLGGERLVDRAVTLLQGWCNEVVVVLPVGVEWDGVPVTASVAGGASRTESLRNALAPLTGEITIVHDAIRPLASSEVIERLVEAIDAGADAAIPGWEPPDTIKRVLPDGSIEHVGREGFLIVQGPIAFRTSTLVAMYQTFAEVPIEETIGIQRFGGRVVAVRGDKWSHHLVDGDDLAVMERLVDP